MYIYLLIFTYVYNVSTLLFIYILNTSINNKKFWMEIVFDVRIVFHE